MIGGQSVAQAQQRRDTVAVLLMLSLVTSAGIFAADILPVMISALREGLSFSAQDAGLVGAANVYGTTFGGVLALLVPRAVTWRRAVRWALVGLVLIDGVSTRIDSFTILMVLRFIHGLIGGISMGIGFGVIARTAAPDRTFGALMLVQFAMVGVSMMVLPRLIAPLGSAAAFLGLGAISLAALAMLPFVPDFPDAPAGGGSRAGFKLDAPMFLAFLTLFMFQLTKMSLYSYLFGLGQSLRLSIDFLSGTLGVAAWVGSLGAWAVVAAGLRFGRYRPLLLMMLIALCAYMALLAGGAKTVVFALALGCIAIAWSFIVPYLFGMCAAFDPSGRSSTWSSFLSTLGMATGPAIGGLVLAETHYNRLLGLAIAGLLACALSVSWPALLLDRAQAVAAE